VLRRAGVEDAADVIVAPDRDDAAVLITLTARELNPGATIVAALREEENAHLLRQSGADTVITTSGAAGRLLGLATRTPAVVEVLEDLLGVGEGLDLVERPVEPARVGGPPVTDGSLVVAVVRGDETIRFDDPRAARTQPGDRLICLSAIAGG
jgi:voltage-gated potassium channel